MAARQFGHAFSPKVTFFYPLMMRRPEYLRKPQAPPASTTTGRGEAVGIVFSKGRLEPERETSMKSLRLLATTLFLSASGAVFAADLPRARPEEVGMSSERLGRI